MSQHRAYQRPSGGNHRRRAVAKADSHTAASTTVSLPGRWIIPPEWVPAPAAVVVIIVVLVLTRGWSAADVALVLAYLIPILILVVLAPLWITPIRTTRRA